MDRTNIHINIVRVWISDNTILEWGSITIMSLE
jgi:hypothetical protein